MRHVLHVLVACLLAMLSSQNNAQQLLQPDWNLLGNSSDQPLSVAATFGDAASPVPGITVNTITVWKWNANALRWQFYSPQLSPQQNADYAAAKGYDVLLTVNPKEGYWVHVAGNVLLPAQTGNPVSLTYFDFSALPAGFNLVVTAQSMTPTQLNNGVAQLTPPSPGSTMVANFVSLWAWDTVNMKWFFYAPALEASGGLAAVKAYAESKSYFHFQDYNKMLGPNVGFWLNK